MRVFLGTLRPLKIHTICSFWMPARKTLHILQGEPIGGLPHATAQFFREIKRAREGGRRASEYRRNKEANGCRSKLLHCNHFRIVHSSSLKFECQMSEARKRMRSVVTVRGTCDAPLRTFAVDEFTQFYRIIFCPAPFSLWFPPHHPRQKGRGVQSRLQRWRTVCDGISSKLCGRLIPLLVSVASKW